MKTKISAYKAKILKERMLASDSVYHALLCAWRDNYVQNSHDLKMSEELFYKLLQPASKVALQYDDEYKEKVLGLPRPKRS